MKQRLFCKAVFLMMFGLVFTGKVLAEDILWVDVRSAEEFASGHHPEAVNIPHTEVSEKIAGYATDKGQVINLYCRSGRRADVAKDALEELGYTAVSNLGGYKDVIAENR